MTTQPPHQEPSTKKPLKIPMMLILIIACLLALLLFFRPATNETVVQDDGEPKVYEKVVYDVSNWQAQPVMTATGQERFDEAKAIILATATKTDALDFDGRPATKYNYTASSEPPLYVIESDEVFEMSWYFAHPKDNDSIKEISQKHAQKAYAVATALYGDDGKRLIEAMLSQSEVEGELLNRHRLRLAECREYMCQLVIQK